MALKEKRIEALVGGFLLLGLGLLAWLVLSFGGFKSGPSDTYLVEVRFTDASSVFPGTKVKLAGAVIGQVASDPVLEAPTPGSRATPKVRVPIAIDERRQLPSNAIFQIQSATVLGDKVIVVTIPEEPDWEPALVDGAMIDGGGASGLEAITSDAVAVADDARLMTKDARTSLDKFDSILDELRTIIFHLEGASQTLNTQILSEENVAVIDRTLANIEDTSVGAKAIAGDLKPLMASIEATLAKYRLVAERADQTFDEIDSQLANLGPAMEEVPETMQSIRRIADKAEGAVVEAERTLAKAGETLDNLNGDEGLVNTLGQDGEVTTDTKAFVKNLRRHGILGYRDEDSDPEDPRERFQGRRR